MQMTSEQVRAARALLRWEQKDLAEASGVSKPTIGRLEMKPGPLDAYESTKAALRSAFESAGVEFIDRGEALAAGGEGVRLKAGAPGTAGGGLDDGL